MPRLPRVVAVVLASLTWSCAPAAGPLPVGGEPDPARGTAGEVHWIPPLPLPHSPARVPIEEEAPALEFRVREAEPLPAAAPHDPAAGAVAPLADAEAAALLQRLTPLPADTPVTARFPRSSPPPPRTGATVLATFPPPDTAAAPPPAPLPTAPAPLEVVRITPAGETDAVGQVVIVFSEPMVPLSSVGAVHAGPVPARLTPRPAGRWQWVDTRTLRFEPEARLPRATRFLVEVPAGTRGLTGRPLERAAAVEFRTPPPRGVGAYPAGYGEPEPGRAGELPPMRREWMPESAVASRQPVILVVFDQAIGPAAVLPHVRLTADGTAQRVRLATAAEVEGDSIVRRLAAAAPAGRWLAIRPVAALPAEAEVRVRFLAGTPSAEGPLTTTAIQAVHFRTFGPLRLESHGCAYGGEEERAGGVPECMPGTPWLLSFSNPLDGAARPDTLVAVEPAVEGLQVQVNGNMLFLHGQFRPFTTYRVRLHPTIRDLFGQSLGTSPEIAFRTGAPTTALGLFGGPMIVLDPAGPRRILVQSRGHEELRVRLYRVQPEDLPAYREAQRRYVEQRGGGILSPPGRLAEERTVRTQEALGFALTEIDLTPALGPGPGHAIVVVESTRSATGPGGPTPRRPMPGGGPDLQHAWVQATEIGLTATVDREELLAWATSLRDGAPLSGVQLSLHGAGVSATTRADGTAVLPLADRSASLLIARRGADAAILPPEVHGWHEGGWMRRPFEQPLRWLVLSDRGLYRPGEEAHLKGWIRQVEPGRRGDLRLPGDVSSIALRATGPRGEEVASDTLRPAGLGGFHTTVRIPEEINLGHVGLQLEAQGPRLSEHERQAWHHLRVQEFRRPEYEVTASADPGPHLIGGSVRITGRAGYYAGGGLPDARIDWSVNAGPAEYTPPGWSGWSFGRGGFWRWRGGRGMRAVSHRGVTGFDGEHAIVVDLLAAQPPFPTRLSAMAAVQDLNRQLGTGRVDLLVHPAELYVGLRAPRGWVRPGEEVTVEVVATTIDGAVRAGREVTIHAERARWGMPIPRPLGDEAAPAPEPERLEICRVTTGSSPVRCSWAPDSAGAFALVAEIRDERGRPSQSELSVWVAGPTPLGAAPAGNPGELPLIADRESYRPGETAEVLVQAPFARGEGLATVRRLGVLETRRFRLEGSTHTLRIPIIEDHIPSVRVRVELIDAEDGASKLAGEVALSVPPRVRELTVALTPRDTVALPGAETAVDVQVTTADGRPAAGAEVALWVVDEAVLSLGGYQVPDPLGAFYPPGWGHVMDHQTQQWVIQAPRSAGPGTVSGQLFSPDEGRPIGRLPVRIEGTELRAVSGVNGVFTIRGVAAGEHVLLIEPTGERITIRVPTDGVHLGPIVLRAQRDQIRPMGPMETLSTVAAAAPPPPPPAPGAAIRARDVVVTQELQVTAARGGMDEEPLAVRAELAPLAVFEPSIRTDAAGRARVALRLPESLTRYRVMAVAVEGPRRFGRGEAVITARRELMVRPSPPRFLNFGDTLEIPVLVQNLGGSTVPVEVAARAAGVRLEGPAGFRVSVPAGDRVEVRFRATALAAGTARLQVAASGGGNGDAAEVAFPVYTPATAEAFATYGDVAGAAPVLIPVSPPEGVLPGFGGLEVTVSATAVQELTDAFLHLQSYPFEGVEQIASRLLATAALRDVLSAFAAEDLPPADAIEAAARRDVARLAELQLRDGGWSWWRVDRPAVPFVTIHATHALLRAREKGYPVPQHTLDRALGHLRVLAVEPETPPMVRDALQAYALYVRQRAGDVEAVREAQRRARAAAAEPFHRQPSLETLGWLLHVVADEPEAQAEAASLLRLIVNRATETAATATFVTRYEEGEHLLLHSARRTDAVVLEALLAADPRSELIPKTARGLLGHRVRGRWGSTHENVWVVLALERYFTELERQRPDFRAGVWWGERFAGSHEFRGRTTERFHLEIPMREVLTTGDTTTLTLHREGEGRMYYRAALRYAPAALLLPAMDRGLRVERSYEAVDDPTDVRRDADGSWTVRPGARVRVRLSVTAPSRRHHVALLDPLPAGFEPLNPELRGTGADFPAPPPAPPTPPQPGEVRPLGPEPMRPPFPGHWFTHQNLRDDRAEVFVTYLPAGRHEFTYLVRATTPGSFVAPAPRAEEMYQPETFGRGEGTRVRVR